MWYWLKIDLVLPHSVVIFGHHHGRRFLGKTSYKKECLLSGIAQISSPPPSPQFGQLGPPFSDVKNNVLRVWQKKKTDDVDDGWNDNYDGDDDNVDEIDEKNYQKTYKCYDLWVEIDLF